MRENKQKSLSLRSGYTPPPPRLKQKFHVILGGQLVPSTLPETNSEFASETGCGWNLIVSFWGRLGPIFMGKKLTVSLRGPGSILHLWGLEPQLSIYNTMYRGHV